MRALCEHQERIDYGSFREAFVAEVCSRRPLPRSPLIDGGAQPCCAREHRDG